MTGFHAQNKVNAGIPWWQEVRGISYAAGGEKGAATIPNFIKRYRPDLQGSSLGSHFFELCYDFPDSDNLNSAQSGSMSMNLETMLEYLMPSLRKHDGDWKLISIQIGANDQCVSCFTGLDYAEKIYASSLDSLLNEIRTQVPRVLVNLIDSVDVSKIFTDLDKQSYCETYPFTNVSLRNFLCPCTIRGENLELMHQLVAEQSTLTSKNSAEFLYRKPLPKVQGAIE
ncbi:hypothetical protein DFQ30_001798 [Apophysomyces sp. BC1015]|nr:hypothetical protein DFQ30_001798 [Apophysomyces sp. BC1015]